MVMKLLQLGFYSNQIRNCSPWGPFSTKKYGIMVLIYLNIQGFFSYLTDKRRFNAPLSFYYTSYSLLTQQSFV